MHSLTPQKSKKNDDFVKNISNKKLIQIINIIIFITNLIILIKMSLSKIITMKNF